MRIVTWNTARGRPEKKLPLLQEAYDVDIAAIQEIGRPKEPLAADCVWKGDNPNIGIMVCARPPLRVRPIAEFHVESELYQAVAVYRGRRKLFNVVNLWTKPHLDPRINRRTYDYSLEVALDHTAHVLGDQVNVVLGDTNMIYLDGKDLCRQMLGSIGLLSAHHGFQGEAWGRETCFTHRHRRFKTEHHTDLLFIPEQWYSRLRNVEVGSLDEWSQKGKSDHAPVVADIDDDR